MTALALGVAAPSTCWAARSASAASSGQSLATAVDSGAGDGAGSIAGLSCNGVAVEPPTGAEYTEYGVAARLRARVLVALDARRPADALAAAQALRMLRPGDPGALHLEATARIACGELDAARRLLDADGDGPAYPDHATLRARLEARERGAERGLAIALDALARAPLEPALLSAAQDLATAADRASLALELARRRLAVGAPHDAAALMSLAHRYLQAGWPETARELLLDVTSVTPELPGARVLLGDACLATGRVEEARAAFESAFARGERSASMWLGRARIAVTLGHRDAALGTVIAGLAEHPADARLLAFALVLGGDTGDEDDWAARAERHLASGGTPESRAALHHGLARLHDRRGRLEDALAAIRACHAERASTPDRGDSLTARAARTLASTRRSDQRTRTVWTSDARAGSVGLDAGSLNGAAGVGTAGARPLLVVGLPRSGTTLVEHRLAGHPAIAAAGELPFLEELANEIAALTGRPLGDVDAFAALPGSLWDRAARDWSAMLRRRSLRSDAAWVVDKWPLNVLHLELARAVQPGVAVVHCIRDTVDTCLSCWFEAFDPRYSDLRDLARLVELHSASVQLVAQARERGTPVFEMRYESLVQDPDTVLVHLWRWLGLDPALAGPPPSRPVLTPSALAVRRPIESHGVGRWQRYLTADPTVATTFAAAATSGAP